MNPPNEEALLAGMDPVEVVDGQPSDDEAAPRPSLAWPIFSCMFYFLSAALTTPAMPRFVNSIANADGSTAVSQAGVELKGTFESVDQLMTFLFDPIWGVVSDRVGRRPLQVLSCVGMALGWATVALGSPMWVLLAGRVLDGVTSCMLPICQSSVKDMSAPEKLSANLGVLQGVAIGAAFLIGGMAGGILAQEAASPRTNFAVASAVAACAAVIIASCAPETLEERSRAPRVDWARANPVSSLSRLSRTRVCAGASMAYLLFWLGLNGLQVQVPELARSGGREEGEGRGRCATGVACPLSVGGVGEAQAPSHPMLQRASSPLLAP